MDISKINNKSLKIVGNDLLTVVFSQELDEKQRKKLSPHISLGATLEDCFSVTTPGEYETKEFWIMAFRANNKLKEVDTYVVNFEAVNICILDSTVKSLSKKQVEKIGVIDILIIDLSEYDREKRAMILEIDPRLLVPVNEKDEVVQEMIKDLGVKSVQKQKKLKVKPEDFSNDDFQLEIFQFEQ